MVKLLSAIALTLGLLAATNAQVDDTDPCLMKYCREEIYECAIDRSSKPDQRNCKQIVRTCADKIDSGFDYAHWAFCLTDYGNNCAARDYLTCAHDHHCPMDPLEDLAAKKITKEEHTNHGAQMTLNIRTD